MIPKSLQNDEIVFSGKIIPSVIDVDYLGGHRLYLEFDDGKFGEVNLLPFVEKIPALNELKNLNKFTQFSLSDGTISWGYNMDISPRWLHEHINSL